MSGVESIIKLTRAILGDLDSVKYSDQRLNDVVIVAAFYLQSVASFTDVYTVSITTNTITPDPTDATFITLCAYKAACLISTYELKNTTGIIMRDGPSMIDTKATAQNKKDGMLSICKIFDQLLADYQLTGGINAGGHGHAILGPYSPGSDLLGWTSPDHRGAEWQ